jgi:hypothetical protein
VTSIASFLGTATAFLVEAVLAAILLIALVAGRRAADRLELGHHQPEGVRSEAI